MRGKRVSGRIQRNFGLPVFGLAVVGILLGAGLLWPAVASAGKGAAPGIEYPEYETPRDISAIVFSRDAEIHDVEMSPDGKHAAIIYPRGDNYLITIEGLEDDDDEQHFFSTIKKNRFKGISWANNERLLLHTEDWQRIYFYGFSISFGMSQIFAVSRTGGDYESIWKEDPRSSWDVNRFRIATMLPDDDQHILIQHLPEDSEYPALSRVDIYTGVPEQVQAPHKGIHNWFTSDAGEVVIGMGWVKKKPVMLVRDSAADDWRELQNNSLFVEGRFEPAYIGQDARHLIVKSSIETGRMAYYRFDIEKGALAEKIFGHPDYDVGDILFTRKSRKIAAVSYIDHRRSYEFLDADYEKMMTAINGVFPQRVNRILGASHDERYFLIYSSSDLYPGAYYRYDREARELKFFGEDYPKIDPEMLSGMSPVSYFSSDGLEIPAYLTLPQGVEPKNLPLIVYPHSDINERNLIGYSYLSQFLASRGLAILQPNYRGSTGYGYSYSTLGNGEWGGAIQDDIEKGVQDLVRRGIVDPDRVCILGQRFAGYSAIMAAIKSPETFKCVIAMAAYVDLRAYMKRLKKAKRKDQIELMQGDRKTKEMRALSPMKLVRQIKSPMLLFHGEDDGIVPLEEVEDFLKASKKAGNAPGLIELVELKDTGRYLSKPRTKLIFLREIEEFLIENIGLEEKAPEAEAEAAEEASVETETGKNAE